MIATKIQQRRHGFATTTMMYSDFVKSVARFGNNAGTKSFFVSGEKNPAMKVANVSNIINIYNYFDRISTNYISPNR